jgi:hypothetical protein
MLLDGGEEAVGLCMQPTGIQAEHPERPLGLAGILDQQDVFGAAEADRGIPPPSSRARAMIATGSVVLREAARAG